MSLWRRLPNRAYLIVMLVAIASVLVWNYFIVSSSESPVRRGRSSKQLEFELNSGAIVACPDSTEKYTVLTFWAAASERSLRLLDEARPIFQEGKYDSLVRFYWVNLPDSLDQIQAAVDFADLSLPYGFRASGQFMDNFQIRSLPLTVVFSPEGGVLNTLEGYQSGDLVALLENLALMAASTGLKGEFRFGPGGR